MTGSLILTVLGAALSGFGAFLWGARIYVLSGSRQLMVNLDKHDLTPEVRATLTSLGKLGAGRLR